MAFATVVSGWRWSWRWRLVGATLVGAALGSLASRAQSRECPRVWKPGPQAAIVRLGDAPRTARMATGTVVFAREGCRGDVRLRLPETSLASGTTVIAVGSASRMGVLTVRHLRTLRRDRSWRWKLRDTVSDRIRRLYGERAPLVDALVLGRRGEIDRGLRDAWVASGLAHLLAISGLHVGIIYGWILLLLGTALRGPRLWIGGGAITWLYVSILGFPVSATRAAVFLTLGAVSKVRQRRPPLSAILAVAVLLLISADPDILVSVGAWLSFAAVSGTRIADRFVRRRAPIRRLRFLAPVVGATVATAPITAFVFGSVPVVGVVTNLVAVPLAALAVPAVFLSLAVGDVLAGGAGLALAGIELVARVGAGIPGGQLRGPPGPAFAAPWVVGLLLITWSAWRQPTLRVISHRVTSGLAALALTGSMVLWGVRPDRSDGLAIHVLDVGQGDAIAVRTPRGRWLVIDGGPLGRDWDAGRRVVAPFLRRQGVQRLDAVIVSHGDADHLGGIPAILEEFRPGLVLEPGQPLGTALYREFMDEIDAVGARWQPARRGDVLEVDSVTLRVVHPTTEWAARELDPNENSIVLRLSYRAFDVLLTGDIGWPAESVLAETIKPVDVLKVGHHGSRGGTRDRWLDRVQPRAAVISVGRGNRYGHPAPDVLRRLEQRDIAVFRTDIGGAVTFRSDGRYFQITRRHASIQWKGLSCRILTSLRLSDSSSSKSGCTRRPPGSSPTSFTTLP